MARLQETTVSVMTIDIPGDQLIAMRDGLLAARRLCEEEGQVSTAPSALDGLLDQIEARLGHGDGVRLTGPRSVLWSAAYDALCTAAERFAEDCNEYWNRPDPQPLKARLVGLGASLDLLEALGPPPELP